MDTASLIRLLALAAIWGSSFLFMRIAVPVLGPTLLIALRVGLAAVFLLGVALAGNQRLDVRRHYRHYLFMGACNSAIPFLLFAFAAQTLSASLLAILNATAPLFAALIASLLRRTLPAPSIVAGLALGVVGVALLAGFDTVMLAPGATIALFAALGASFSYAIASNYAKSAPSVDPFANAHGSMWAATLLLVPAAPFFPPAALPTTSVALAVVALGVLCSGVAYLLYFRLIADLGAASALTVTFLIPVFGVLWGTLFLNEHIGWYTIVGSVTVVAGTALVTGYVPRFMPRASTRR
jgi:drug/metabolite transporter (DMT)-like permease